MGNSVSLSATLALFVGAIVFLIAYALWKFVSRQDEENAEQDHSDSEQVPNDWEEERQSWADLPDALKREWPDGEGGGIFKVGRKGGVINPHGTPVMGLLMESVTDDGQVDRFELTPVGDGTFWAGVSMLTKRRYWCEKPHERTLEEEIRHRLEQVRPYGTTYNDLRLVISLLGTVSENDDEPQFRESLDHLVRTGVVQAVEEDGVVRYHLAPN